MDIDSEPAVAASLEPQMHGFFRLPAELRNQVYSELLVTDCAFRLGYVFFGLYDIKRANEDRHHGPYSHEPREQIYPAILRTCSAVYHEAVAILYGNNSFFLGTWHSPLAPLL